LKLVNQASDYWLNHQYPISFLLQLGDIIDGLCEINKTSNDDLQMILKQFRNFSPIYHLWGNHELYNFKREQLLNGPLCSFNTEMISPSHYGTIEVCPKLKILAVDTYELSLIGVEKDSETYRQALDVFRQHNPNEKVNEWNGLEGFQRRYTQLNGALTRKQLDWLKEELTKARNLDQNVIIIGKKRRKKKRTSRDTFF
jgi:predicted MPP superfamily phosphohydrolase